MKGPGRSAKALAVHRAIVAAFCLLAIPSFGRRALAADYVWLEGERPSRANVQTAPVGWGNKQYLSEAAWLNIGIPENEVEQKIPQGGVILGYDFDAKAAGRYEVWNRIGYEFVRSAFQWRVDQADWQDAKPDDLTTDLMDVSFWCEVAWLKLGEADLTDGRHTLEIRLPLLYAEKDGKKVPQRVLYASDALCLYKGQFRPNGRFQPDADWQTDADRNAAGQVFEVKAGAAAGERVVTPLSGLWQVARADEQVVQDRLGPIRELPPADALFWSAIRVPGDRNRERPDLVFCHRYFCRTRVRVPAEMQGRSFFVHFPSTNMVASVFVNGRLCGWNKAPFAVWDCDVTGALKPGEVNEIQVGIKDTYYAIARDTRRSFNMPASLMDGNQGVSMTFDMPVWNHRDNGILEPLELVAAGPVYAADVFAIPSVKDKSLTLEVSVVNATGSDRSVTVENEVAPLEGGPAEKRFAPQALVLSAGKQETFRLTETWESPKLWWPDSPRQYNVVTKIVVDGRPADTRLTKFGFREWSWDGPEFRLNGVPWHGRADLSGSANPDETVRVWKKHGQTMTRFWGTSWAGMTQGDALDFFDRSGVPVRRSGIFDGEAASYGLTESVRQDGRDVTVARKALFDNWIEQTRAWIKGERNHPSVFIWSLENEIVFINSINFGTINTVAPEITRCAREAMALDPTRPVIVDGGRALPDNSLPVNGCHYDDPEWRELPDASYSMDYLQVPRFHEGWPLKPNAPVFLGEAFFAAGSPASAYSMTGGDQAFLGRTEARTGVGLLAKMMSEGYRWQGLAAFHFWFGSGDTNGEHYVSWQPVCALVREWNWTFASSSKVKRTLKVLNDTHYADPIEMRWQFSVGGKVVQEDRKVLSIAPGAGEVAEVVLTVPAVHERTAGELVLTCTRGGKEVFRDVKPLSVIDPDAASVPAFAAGELLVLDPAGSMKARLSRRGIQFTEVADFTSVPDDAKLLVVGRDALTGREATDPRWKSLAANGCRILVLDQQNPLHYQAVPADFEVTDRVGRIAFPEDLTHPVFAGLDRADFFTWYGDHVVYRNAYRKASRGAKSLAQCDEGLGCTALSECVLAEGLLLLSQFDIGAKLDSDPVAQRLFDNMLDYCASYRRVRKMTAVTASESSPITSLLKGIGLEYQAVPDAVQAISDPKYEIVVAEATPATLRSMAQDLGKVKAFTGRGGWLVLWGLTPDGLAEYDKIVGVDHVIRPFEMERVTLSAVRDPILSGLTVRDVAMESGERIFPWAGDKYMVDDEFTYVVDLDDIAPFCEVPGAAAGDHAAAKNAAAGWARNIFNGFTSADAWKLIHYLPADAPRIKLNLARPEVITDFGIVLNIHYCKATKVNLYFDDDPAPVSLPTKPIADRQDFQIEPRKAAAVTIELADFDAPGQTTGIDNVWIRVQRSEEWKRSVKPLLNIGALVKYPMGRGGVLLNQIRVLPTESVPVNAQKKATIAATLLRNLGAVFQGGDAVSLALTRFRYEPVPLGDKCNQFLTGGGDHWFKDAKGRDLRQFPVGEGKFAGVPFLIRDFKTSPVPACVMLNGEGDQARSGLASEVTGIPVGKRADALFFLHTFNQYNRAEDRRNQNPVVFQYTVHYADGQTAVIPVRLDLEVSHWTSKDPKGLKGAALAWAAPFPNDDSGAQAAVYQMQWMNPRPEAEVTSVDVTYGEAGSRMGMPAVLAITAARAAE